MKHISNILRGGGGRMIHLKYLNERWRSAQVKEAVRTNVQADNV